MIKSMTGFGRAEASAGPFKATVEVRSVNHRFADLKIKLPADLSGYEAALQQRLQAKVQRGRLDASVNVWRGAEGAPPVEINRALVGSYLKAADQIRREFGLGGEVTVQAVLELPDVVRLRGGAGALSGEEQSALMAAFDGALSAHEAMREQEGRILARDLLQRVAAIAKLRDRIEKRAPRMLPLYVKRLRKRVEDLCGAGGRGARAAGIDASRLAQEVALLAERSDITEELVRLAGYLEQLRGLLGSAKEPVGKKLDFIMQEMNREANTINSKAIDLAICQDALEVKAQVEKIREQVQNIE